MRRLLRVLGTLLITGGVLMLIWTAVVWRWQDPFTAIYTHYEQGKLSKSYDRIVERYRDEHPPGPIVAAGKPGKAGPSPATARTEVAEAARRYRHDAKQGQAIGRINVPRLGLNMVFVNGTDDATLKKGPGRELHTFMPGQGELVYIAGHRTTYLAPFSHIEHLRPGDLVTLTMPYGTFTYRITNHVIVNWNDLAVLKSHGREVVALQACHPRFFASHRYIAYASLVHFALPGGRGYDV